jgi:hypothetical protein
VRHLAYIYTDTADGIELPWQIIFENQETRCRSPMLLVPLLKEMLDEPTDYRMFAAARVRHLHGSNPAVSFILCRPILFFINLLNSSVKGSLH